jgi:hypothetical protein
MPGSTAAAAAARHLVLPSDKHGAQVAGQDKLKARWIFTLVDNEYFYYYIGCSSLELNITTTTNSSDRYEYQCAITIDPKQSKL